MSRKLLLLPFGFLLAAVCFSQTNTHFTNPEIYDILKGNYDPATYAASEVIDDPYEIAGLLLEKINPDSLRQTLIDLQRFENRNTGSDTLSAVRGIGAARTWVLDKFMQFSAVNEGRLLTGYLQFDQTVCNVTRHKNVVAVLPGRDTSDASSILIEAHLDSRCAVLCDIDCLAQGMEDNGSGVALVLELARVMSQFTFDNTIVFMATIGEEQGLVGAEAYALYAKQENIPIKAVLNNDIVGGIICGETSSPPSCPGLNDIDSTQVRLFSSGGSNSKHKSLARFIKLEYFDMLFPIAKVPMMITVMSAEDRTGRGGDHIPFRQQGFPAMRFTSANEHGDAGVSEPDYHDRQHTSDDILGLDTDGDLVLDSFFVDFNYLARNASINGNAAAMAALGPETPVIANAWQNGDQLYVEISDPHDYNEYVIGMRILHHDFDTLYRLTGSKSGYFDLPSNQFLLFITAASVDGNGVESLFSDELTLQRTGTSEADAKRNIELLQNKPNPYDESTMISFLINDISAVKNAKIVITDMNGNRLKEMDVEVAEGMNEVLYHHGYNMTGTYLYSLFINGHLFATRKMVFAN